MTEPLSTPAAQGTVAVRIAGERVSVPFKIIQRIRDYRAAQPYDPVLSQIEIDMNIAIAPSPEALPASEAEKKELLKRIGSCLADPMWSDHAEISKATLRRLHAYIGGK